MNNSVLNPNGAYNMPVVNHLNMNITPTKIAQKVNIKVPLSPRFVLQTTG